MKLSMMINYAGGFKEAVQRVVDWFCNGSVDEVLVGMVDTAMLDRKRLRMLSDRIDRTKGKT